MIKLSGLKLRNKDNPEGDIEIKYTGLRQVKLYEELLIDASKESTEHHYFQMKILMISILMEILNC